MMPLTGGSLGPNRCMIHHTMYDTLINVYPSPPADLEFIILLLASILFAVVVTAELDLLLWHATDCTGKLPSELYIIIVKTCFACAHFKFYLIFFSNLLLKLPLKVCQQQ